MKNNLNIQETVYQFCKLYNPQLQKDKIRILLESSPFYPSVLSVYRALLSCKIDCNVVKTDIHGLLSLHQTMLLHIKEKENDKLVLVKSLKDEQAVYYDSFKQQYHVINTQVLLSSWDGVIIYSCATEQKRDRYHWLYFIFLFLFILLIFREITGFFISLNIIGLIVSFLLINQEFNLIENSILNRYCKIGKIFNCDKVIHSKIAHLKSLSLAELGSIYFISNLFWIITATLISIPQEYILGYLKIINLLCIPFILFLTFYQMYLKKWCLLCLSVCFVICIESLLSFCLEINLFISYPLIKIHLLACTISCFGIFFLTKYIKLSKSEKTQQIEALRIKRNPNVFHAVMRKQPQLKEENKDYLLVGNQESSIIITTWISPYCPHCANIVTDILSLYDKTNGNIQWRIYWAGKADKHSYYNKVQLHLIAIYKEDKQKFMLAIKKWYKYHKTSLFATQSNNRLPIGSIDILEKQIQYSQDMQIKTYPSVFLNNCLLPKEYSLKDLSFMLHDKEIWEHQQK